MWSPAPGGLIRGVVRGISLPGRGRPALDDDRPECHRSADATRGCPRPRCLGSCSAGYDRHNQAADELDSRVLLSTALSSNEVARKALSLMVDAQAAKARSPWVREAREEAIRTSIASVLAARGLSMSPEHRAVLDARHDVAVLERWITQAALAATVDEERR